MIKALMLAGCVAVLQGCATRAAPWKGEVLWPDESSSRTVVEPMEAGAALAAAGAIREVVRTNPFPNLFAGCSSPEQGLDVSVFAGTTPGLYFVVVDQRFHRCGGPSGRVLDWWEVYAVTSQGVVVEKAPTPTGDAPADSLPPEKSVPPPEPTPDKEVAPPASLPSPHPEASTAPSMPSSLAVPEVIPPAPMQPHPENK
ncbi:hypothetical protein HUA76_09955 [Myxococcus sp. CA056]|uniref:hypothetical protein n=1 Tax=unclassified Myxococcus TaxID=2648731 RepID=UPI00157A4F51|nr:MULTISPECIES: hypothetical protein [unclassified Myxococcus]NTX11110.1 hypothetical protein [Myxococcus sp. CA056]NTX51913.1 hypothetical protein [Myxococcus sp. CA039A]